jgi:hypothetical protein
MMTYISLSFGVARKRQALPTKARKMATILVQNVPNLSKNAPKTMVPNEVRLDPIAKIEFNLAFCSVSLFPSLFKTFDKFPDGIIVC